MYVLCPHALTSLLSPYSVIHNRMVEVKTEAEAEVDGQVFPLVKPEIKEDVKEEVLAGATCLNLQLRITHDCR